MNSCLQSTMTRYGPKITYIQLFKEESDVIRVVAKTVNDVLRMFMSLTIHLILKKERTTLDSIYSVL